VLLQTHNTIMTQLLQSSVRLLDCPWLQLQHRGQVETCIKTLAMTGNVQRNRPEDTGSSVSTFTRRSEYFFNVAQDKDPQNIIERWSTDPLLSLSLSLSKYIYMYIY